jgi:hypothetical protein
MSLGDGRTVEEYDGQEIVEALAAEPAPESGNDGGPFDGGAPSDGGASSEEAGNAPDESAG